MTFRQEFQAVVLAAGKGSRMPEITAGLPRCLLPVGTRPLVWYPLFKLQQTGFKDVILVVAENQKLEIQNTLEKTDLEIRIDYASIPVNEDLGTADSLRLIHDKLKSDVLILPCDLVTNGNLHGVLDMFRKHNASICTSFFAPQKSEQVVVPGPKSKHKFERDLIGVDTHTNRLVFLASASDFETDVTLQKSLLRKHTNITMFSNLIDSHIYVLKKWIIKYLKHVENISTLKGELLPHIIKKQLAKPRKFIDTNTSVVNTQDSSDIFQFATESDLDVLIRDTSTYNDHYGDLKSCYQGDSIRCFAHISGPKYFGVRVNTLPAYWSVNARIKEIWDEITNCKNLVKVDPKADIKSNQLNEDCIVWELCELKEKTSFKNSIIGSSTQVNSFSRVFNCIVMNNVVVKERVALENCIVCDNVVVETGSQLKSCIVGSHHTIGEQSVHTNEVLTTSGRYMEF